VSWGLATKNKWAVDGKGDWPPRLVRLSYGSVVHSRVVRVERFGRGDDARLVGWWRCGLSLRWGGHIDVHVDREIDELWGMWLMATELEKKGNE
jgi:hypothetical protein